MMTIFLSGKCKRGFTLLELFIVIVIVLVLVAMFFPNVRSTREAARRIHCANNTRQIAIALLNYEEHHGHFPAAMGGPDFGLASTAANMNRRSGLVLLLPFIEQQLTWEQISDANTLDGIEYPAMGPEPWNPDYPPWKTEIPLFRCPSALGGQTGFGETNYAFCIGDMARGIHQPARLRGAFACQMNSTMNEMTDGTSNTIAIAEIGTSPENLLAGHYATHQSAAILDNPGLCKQVIDSTRPNYYAPTIELGVPGRGGCWADGAAGCSLVNTVLPPNSPSCAVGGAQAVDGIYSAGGFHIGLINVAMLDGSTRAIPETIDAGDPSQPTLTMEQMAEQLPSPFGVWGALGTSASADEADSGW